MRRSIFFVTCWCSERQRWEASGSLVLPEWHSEIKSSTMMLTNCCHSWKTDSLSSWWRAPQKSDGAARSTFFLLGLIFAWGKDDVMIAFVGVGWAHHVTILTEILNGVLHHNWGPVLETASLIQESNIAFSFSINNHCSFTHRLSWPRSYDDSVREPATCMPPFRVVDIRRDMSGGGMDS